MIKQMINIGSIADNDLEWKEEMFDDLSACWLVAQDPYMNLELCIQFDGFKDYKLWVSETNDGYPLISLSVESIEQAKNDALAIIQQLAFDSFNLKIKDKKIIKKNYKLFPFKATPQTQDVRSDWNQAGAWA